MWGIIVLLFPINKEERKEVKPSRPAQIHNPHSAQFLGKF